MISNKDVLTDGGTHEDTTNISPEPEPVTKEGHHNQQIENGSEETDEGVGDEQLSEDEQIDQLKELV